MIAPTTDIRLIKVPFTLSNKHQLTFSNIENQTNYFLNLPFKEVDNTTYQRKDGIIRFPEILDNIINYNYVMYKNEAWGDKWFYAFITNMEFASINMTYIKIDTDCFQTWQFELNWHSSFIDREMINSNDDIPGANLIPENLEIGELTIDNVYSIEGLQPIAIIAYGGDPHEDGLTPLIPDILSRGIIANGIPNGVYYCICSISKIKEVLYQINLQHGQNIITIFTVPIIALEGLDGLTINDLKGDIVKWLVTDFKADIVIHAFNVLPSTLNGYTPINQKLRTYPYIYLGFNPPNGTANIFRYEDFKYYTPIFKLLCELMPNPTAYFIPINYRGIENDNINDSVSLNGYPLIGWTTDYFNSWLAQNGEIIKLNLNQEQFNYELNTINSAISNMSNITTGAFNNNIGSVVNNAISFPLDMVNKDVNHDYYIKNTMAQIEKQKLLPNPSTSGSSNTTLLGYNYIHKNIFTTYSIKYQYAQRIDNYFSMYGYATNQIKIPNLSNRPNWNYIKTIGANIIADIPQIDLQLIKNMFDNGITLWHNPNTFLDYTQNNK